MGEYELMSATEEERQAFRKMVSAIVSGIKLHKQRVASGKSPLFVLVGGGTAFTSTRDGWDRLRTPGCEYTGNPSLTGEIVGYDLKVVTLSPNSVGMTSFDWQVLDGVKSVKVFEGGTIREVRGGQLFPLSPGQLEELGEIFEDTSRKLAALH